MFRVSSDLKVNTQSNTWMTSLLSDFNLPTISNLANQAIESLLSDVNHCKLDKEGHQRCLDSCYLYGTAALGCVLACNRAYNSGSLSSYQVNLLT